MAVLGSSSPIKSIQRGASIATGGNVTINAVDLSKSFVSSSFRSAYGNTGNGISGAITLASSTTIQALLGSSGSYLNYPTVYWEVIEYV